MCPIGLYVAQQEHPEFSIKTDELAVFKSLHDLYPYSVYDLDESDIDKQETTKGELDNDILKVKS